MSLGVEKTELSYSYSTNNYFPFGIQIFWCYFSGTIIAAKLQPYNIADIARKGQGFFGMPLALSEFLR